MSLRICLAASTLLEGISTAILSAIMKVVWKWGCRALEVSKA
jgi:hypothetical protein